jgi:hypothetical protein
MAYAINAKILATEAKLTQAESIGDRAFYQCTSLVTITIPSSVTSIGISAFYHCSSLVVLLVYSLVTLH